MYRVRASNDAVAIADDGVRHRHRIATLLDGRLHRVTHRNGIRNTARMTLSRLRHHTQRIRLFILNNS